MKPVVVLGLVATAIAALFFVLFGSSAPGTPTEPIGLQSGPPSAGSAGPQRTTEIELTTKRTDVLKADDASARAIVRDDSGTELNGAWSNGLTGTVLTPDKTPLAGVRLTLERHKFANQMKVIEAVMARQTGEQLEAWSTTSDDKGRFSFLSLPPGMDYSLTAGHTDFSLTEKPGLAVNQDSITETQIVMTTGYQLRGRIMDDVSGMPIAGATLTLQSAFALLAGATHNEDMQVSSDQDGTYRIENIPAGTRTLTIIAAGYGSRTRNNLLFAGPKLEPQNVDFRLAPGICLRGQVLAPDHTPIAGANIEATSYVTAQVSRGRGISDRNGFFEICDLAEGTFMVMVRANGFSDQRLTAVKLTDPNIQVIMARQGGVMGKVVSMADGSIVTSFRASVRMVAPGSTTYGRSVATAKFNSPEGAFELGGLEAGSYAMQVEAPGFAPTYSDTFIVSQGIVTADIRVEISRGGTISGRIIDAVSGQPIPGARIETRDNNFIRNPLTAMLGGLVPRTTTDRKVRTDKDGAFSLDLITAATYQLQIDHDDFTQKTINDLIVTDGRTRDLGSIRLPKGAQVQGTVYGPAGAPLANARISLTGGNNFPDMVRSDASGRFTLKNVRAGTWKLSAVRASSESPGNPFGTIIDMQKSQITILVSNGQTLVRDLTIGN